VVDHRFEPLEERLVEDPAIAPPHPAVLHEFEKRDTERPGLEVRAGFELRGLLAQDHVRLLEQVVGGVSVEHERDDVPAEPSL
jgi:hypothetical protein